jgi:hypothetical protein
MHDLIQKAVIVIDSGPWLDSDRNVAGKRVLLIRADDDKKRLSAALLFEDESSVIEFSSSCLRTLLAIEK